MQLFHYHLVTSQVRELEARYLAKLGFRLVARYGRVGETQASYEPGVSWEELDKMGFKLRLSELERGAVNVVIQPGQWRQPRIDHLGFACDDEEFLSVLDRATQLELRVHERAGRRTFVGTNAGYRLEVHPQRDWIDDLLAGATELQLAELQLRADEPAEKVSPLVDVLGLEASGDEVRVGTSLLRFLPDGPRGRPELHGEVFG